MTEMENKPVDFSNPEALEAELAAVEAPVEKKAKVKKERKPRMVTCPHCGKEFELPKAAKRGIVAGIPVEEMTEDQLKIEYRNAKSVHYKQTKAKGQPTEVAQARLDKVVEEMTKRGIEPGTRTTRATVDASAIAELIKSGKVSVDDIQALLDQQ